MGSSSNEDELVVTIRRKCRKQLFRVAWRRVSIVCAVYEQDGDLGFTSGFERTDLVDLKPAIAFRDSEGFVHRILAKEKGCAFRSDLSEIGESFGGDDGSNSAITCGFLERHSPTERASD